MRVLVTGAAGFIGSHVAKALLERGHEVHAVVRPGSSAARLEPVSGDLTLYATDLLDEAGVAATLREAAPEATVHLAWYTEPGSYLDDRKRNLASVAASAMLFGLLGPSGCQRLVVGGSCFEAPTDSERRPTFYAVCKRAVHDLATHLDDGLTVACGHIFSVYGPGEHPARAVPSIVRALLHDEPVDVTQGAHLRDYLYVGDVAEALCTVLAAQIVGTVDICSGQPRPIGDVFEEIGRATGRGHLIRRGARPVLVDEEFDVRGDPDAIEALGWKPSRSLPEGIAETVTWWRAQHFPPVPSPR